MKLLLKQDDKRYDRTISKGLHDILVTLQDKNTTENKICLIRHEEGGANDLVNLVDAYGQPIYVRNDFDRHRYLHSNFYWVMVRPYESDIMEIIGDEVIKNATLSSSLLEKE